jgi:hypothetical protein
MWSISIFLEIILYYIVLYIYKEVQKDVKRSLQQLNEFKRHKPINFAQINVR